MSDKPVSYLQTDPRWASIPYAVKGESSTIGGSGCGPTSMAMVLATWCDKNVTPKTECAWALAHGYKAKNQGTYYAYFTPAAARYGLDCRQINSRSIYGNGASPHHDTVKAALKKGCLVIACMGKGLWTRSGHFVVVWDIRGNVIYINDPASNRAARLCGNYAVFKQEVKYYWIIQPPAGKKEDKPEMSNFEIAQLIKETVRAEIAEAKADIVLSVLSVLPKPIVYNSLAEVPAWGKAAVERRLENGTLEGTGDGLAISPDLLRAWVILDREAELRKTVEQHGMD